MLVNLERDQAGLVGFHVEHMATVHISAEHTEAEHAEAEHTGAELDFVGY